MSVTLLGGECRGFALRLPPQHITRPTAAPLKRRIFDAYQDLTDHTFVDLCAGSGSMGFEALSRGASDLILVEKNRKVILSLKHNLAALRESYASMKSRRVLVVNDSVDNWLTKNWDSSFHHERCILYLDPPYELTSLYEQVLTFLNQRDFRGELWLEGSHQKGASAQEWVDMVQCQHKIYRQGTSYILRFMFCS